MRQKSQTTLAMLMIVTLLLTLIAGCGINTSKVPAETTGAAMEAPTTEENEETTEVPTTAEPETEEPTTEEPLEPLMEIETNLQIFTRMM